MLHNCDVETSANAATSIPETKAQTLGPCRPFVASIGLINAFQAVSFPIPLDPAFSIRIFNEILWALQHFKCTQAKLAILQFLMRLRADCDHHLYFVENVNKDVHPLAALIGRTRDMWHDSPSEDSERRTRSASRGIRRGGGPNSGAVSRSRSRHRVPHSIPSRSGSKMYPMLWVVPEYLAFEIPNTELSSDSITTYETNAPSEWENLKHWLPVSDYVLSLIEILKSDEPEWELVSYILCHLPIQLANKHFFCGPKTKEGVIMLFLILCTVTLQAESAQQIADHMPDSLKLRDLQGIVYPSLAVLISYKRIFDERKHHDLLVESFLAGLSSKPSTVKICLNALSVCATELPTSMTKHLMHILENLTRIITNPAMAVHILDFLSIIGSIPTLYANFREEEFRMVFAVAVSYIHYHNNPDFSGDSASFALSQHVLVMAYYIIYIWFLAVPLPDRLTHVEFLARRLMLANEAKVDVDEPTEVCFDWLARYTSCENARADSASSPPHDLDIVMSPPVDEIATAKLPIPKTWLWGNSLVSIRIFSQQGWIEVQSVRPSGEWRFFCKLDEVARVKSTNEPDVSVLRKENTAVEVNTLDQGDMHLRNDSPKALGASRESSDNTADASESALSQEDKELTIDPSCFSWQLSQYPGLPKPTVYSQFVTGVPHLESLLRTLKVTPVIDTHKIAIIYVAPGQQTEKEILGNINGSPAYTRFLEKIGRRIKVRDQKDVYTGDLIPDTDGEYAYAWWDDIVQVVFHTATLMPNLSMAPDHTYKKRHIGNDKVRIVWNDSGLPYNHHTIPSEFNFVNIVVEPHSKPPRSIIASPENLHEHEFLRVTMQCMPGMPEFGPIGEYKVVSAGGLGLFLRQVSLLADFMSEVYQATEKDTEKQEYVTNWRRRLQYIKKFRERLIKEPISPAAE